MILGASRNHLATLILAACAAGSGCQGTISADDGPATGGDPAGATGGAGGSGNTTGGGGKTTGSISGAGGAVTGGASPGGASTGGVVTGGASTGGADTAGGGSGGLPPLKLDAGPVVMRRLNRVEYNNTVRDLFQTTARPADAFPSDQLSEEGFDTVGAVLSISPLHAESYETAASKLVEDLFALPSTSTVRQSILSCSLTAGSDPACDLPLETLLLGNFTIANARLATHYGVTAPAGSGFAKVSLAGTPRVGVLTQTSFLMANAHADRTSPVLRGVWVLERLLCTPPPPPPPNFDIPPMVETLPGLTLRQSLEVHRKDPACAGCHSLFDPIGLGFENFDGIGKYRTVDNGLAVDSSGALGGKAFDSPAQLAPLLANDPASCPAWPSSC